MSEAVPEPVSVSVVAGACSCVGVRACVGGGMYLCPRLCLCLCLWLWLCPWLFDMKGTHAFAFLEGRKDGQEGRKETAHSHLEGRLTRGPHGLR